MKSTKFQKKLRLSKSTVSTLTVGSLHEIIGGKTVTICKTCGDECTVYTYVSCIPPRTCLC
jgi:hypothetical protein